MGKLRKSYSKYKFSITSLPINKTTIISKSQNPQTTEEQQEMKNITCRSLRGNLAFLANLRYFIRGEHILAVSTTTRIISLAWTIEAPGICVFNERT